MIKGGRGRAFRFFGARMPLALTTLSRVKALLFSGEQATDQHDAAIQMLIVQASEDIQRRCHRRFVEQAYTDEDYDGSGTERLLLNQGPIVTWTSLKRLNSDGTVAETVAAADYIVEGLRSKFEDGCGSLRMRSGRFSCGRANYRVTYTAGWVDDVDPNNVNAFPHGLELIANYYTRQLFNLRVLPGLSSKAVGDTALSTIPDANLERQIEMLCQPFKRMRVA